MARIVQIEITVELGETRSVVSCGFDLLNPWPASARDAWAVECAKEDGSALAATEAFFDAIVKGVTIDGQMATPADIGPGVKDRAIHALLTSWRARGKGQRPQSSETSSSPAAHVQASSSAETSGSSEPATDARTSPSSG